MNFIISRFSESFTPINSKTTKLGITPGDHTVCFQFSNKPVYGGTAILGTSIYVPDGYGLTLKSATAIGASGDFTGAISMNRYGNFYRPSTTNQNLGGYMIQATVTIQKL